MFVLLSLVPSSISLGYLSDIFLFPNIAINFPLRTAFAVTIGFGSLCFLLSPIFFYFPLTSLVIHWLLSSMFFSLSVLVDLQDFLVVYF